MATPLNQYLTEEEDRDEAFKYYQALPSLSTTDAQNQLFTWSDSIARKVGDLIAINACLGCGKSLSSTTTICENCGDMQDNVFDVLWAIAECGDVGRITS